MGPTMSASRLFVLVQGVSVGLLGAIHGASETMNGLRSTGGFVFARIGAVTVIPNYLLTGLAAIAVALSIVVWTIFFIDTAWGSPTFLRLSLLLLVVGGGIAHVPFFLIAWGVSTRISKPLTWWRKVLGLLLQPLVVASGFAHDIQRLKRFSGLLSSGDELRGCT